MTLLLRRRPNNTTGGNSPLSLLATPSAATAVGQAYLQINTASGGRSPYSFAVTAGVLPQGLTIGTTTGTVSGTPGASAAGPFSYTVKVTDSVGATDLAVSNGTMTSSALILTSSLASVAQVGAPFSQTNTASGGVQPYVFSISAGAVISGTSLNTSTGTVSGTPGGGTAGSFSYTVKVTDNAGTPATSTTSGTVQAASTTVPAASASVIDVQLAVNAAQDGDTVTVPAGVAIWDRRLEIFEKTIRLVGAGMQDGGTWIYHSGGNSAVTGTLFTLISIWPNQKTGFAELAGFHFLGPGQFYQLVAGTALTLTSESKWNNCRVHHNHFENFGNWTMLVRTMTGAVLDGNRWSGIGVSGIQFMGKDDPNFPAVLSEWAEDPALGSLGVGAVAPTVVEDNEFDFEDIPAEGSKQTPAMDLYRGGRLVWRYNTLTNGFFQTHDRARSTNPGGFQYEVYNNYFVSKRAGNAPNNKAIDLASGTGVVFNNVIVGTWSTPIGAVDERSDYSRSAQGQNQGLPMCDGFASLDENTAGQRGHICEQQIGSYGVKNSGGFKAAAVYLWNNRLASATGALVGITNTWSGGGTAQQIADSAVLTNLHLQEGRDYFAKEADGVTIRTTPKPGYTALAYPHPLRASGTQYGLSYFVDFATGSDSNTGKSSALPWKYCPGMAGWTGSATLNPGDTVYFHRAGNWTATGTQQGLYLTGGVKFIGDQWPHGNASPRATLNGSGTKTAGIVFFRDHATQPTTLQGFNVNANSQASTGISMNLIDGATPGPLTGALKTIRNCVVHDVGGAAPTNYTYGIIVSDHVGASGEVANVLIENNIVHDIARDGLCLYPGDANATDIVRNATVRNNEVYNTGMDPGYTRGSGIVVKGRVIDSVIENNSVHDISKGSGIFVNSNETNHYGTGTENLHIRNNVVLGNIAQGSIRLFDGGGTDPRSVHIYGNICHSNTTGNGLHIGDNLLGANTLRIYNNTFFNAPVAVSGVAGATFPVFEFKNNLVVNTTTTVPLVATAAFTAHNNNVFRSTGSTLVSQGGTFTAANLTTYEATALSSDPLFKNPGATTLPTGFNGIYGLIGTNTSTLFIMKPNTDGLSLQAGSPALNSGAALAAPYTMSINSVTRTTFDRGAWEA